MHTVQVVSTTPYSLVLEIAPTVGKVDRTYLLSTVEGVGASSIQGPVLGSSRDHVLLVMTSNSL